MFILFFSSFTNIAVFADSRWEVGKTWNKQEFLSELSQWVYKVNFRDVTLENAWKVMQTFKWKQNFPDKLVLPRWLSLDLNEVTLNAKFQETDLMQQKVNTLKDRNVNFWKFNLEQPEIRILPDRIQLVQRTTIEYKSDAQLQVIKRYIQWQDIKDKTQDKLIKDLNNKLPETATRWINLNDLRFNSDNLKNSNNKKIKWLSVDQIPDSIDDDIFLELQKECFLEYGRNSTRCNDTNFKDEVKNATKEIETEEIISFTLIPPTPEQVKEWRWLINLNPQDVRITLQEIEANFDNYGILHEEIIRVESENWTPEEITQNMYENENYCTELYWEWTQQETQCKALHERKNNPQEKTYTKQMLNWFTIWESNRYEFNKKIKINLLFKKIKIFEVWFGFYYSYGFGIRIPIESEINVNKDVVDDWNSNSSRYNFSIATNTFDATPDQYREMWLPQNKVFDWKEFVFEFTAWFTYKIRALKLIDIDWDISLIEILATVLWKNELKNALWLTEEQYQTMVEEKWINKSKNFIPPFDWSNRVQLAKFWVPVPIIDWSRFKLLWYIWTEILLDGRINALCKMLNSTWWCNNNRVELNRAWINYQANATYNEADTKSDLLGNYSNFWVSFEEYRYIPELVFRIFTKAWASAKIPLYGWYDIRTPEITIYEFKFSDENVYLGAHEWANSKIEAIEQKVYQTRPNIVIETPVIWITTQMWIHNNLSELYLDNNINQWTWYVYTLDWNNPDCRNSSRINNVNEKIRLWTNPTQSPLISPKITDIKVRWCSTLWDWTEIAYKQVALRNDSFIFNFTNTKNTAENKSNDKYDISSWYSNYLNFRYTINWWNPSIANWTLFNEPFNFDDIAKNTLQNNFQVSLKWIAYNNNNATFNQIMTGSFNIKNVYFDPEIKLDHVLWKFWVYSKVYENELYSTYIVYNADWTETWDLNCNSRLRVYMQWTSQASPDLRGNNTMMLQNWTIPYRTSPIRVKTCIANPQGVIVFESDTITKLPKDNMFLDAWKYEHLRDKLEDWRFGKEFMDSLLGWWLDWFLDQEWVMDFMRETLWWLTDWWVREIFGMFGNWDLTVDWLRDLWWNLDMRNWMSQNQRLWWLRSWISSNRFTQRWVNWIVRNMQNNNLSVEWINNFSNLIQTFSNIPQAPTTFSDIPPSTPPSADTENFCRQTCTKFYWLDQTCYNNCVSNLSGMEFDIDQWNWNNENNNETPEQSQENGDELIKSNDPYINSKLTEIDTCFTENYNSHLNNLNNAIDKLSEEYKKLEKTDPRGSSYLLAIEKLQELKKIFIKKYWFMWLTLTTK